MRAEKAQKKKERGHIRIKVVVLMLIMALLATPLTYAGNNRSTADIDKEIDQKEAEKNQALNDKKEAEAALAEGKARISQLTSEIKALDSKIYTAQVEINDLNKEINATKEEITAALERLAAKEEEVEIQNAALNQRLRAMYKNGNAGMFSVLLGSTSMSDLLTNMDMVERIYQSDQDLLSVLQDQYAEIDAEKQVLQELKDKLVAQQDEVKARKEALEKDQRDAEAKRKQVEASNAELTKQIDAFNQEAKALEAEILKLQSEKAYAGGGMIWPSAASRRITSPFGNRLHPILKIYKFHSGIDIGASYGTNILAANSGTVIKAGYNSSYGYMVMIDHGGGIVTLYAHSSKLLVSTGDTVKKGQTIALIGSTGMSTGPHLHFEVRVNGVYKNPLDYVSP